MKPEKVIFHACVGLAICAAALAWALWPRAASAADVTQLSGGMCAELLEKLGEYTSAYKVVKNGMMHMVHCPVDQPEKPQ